MTDNIRRQLQEIALGIEEEAINLPIELCEEAISETQFSLIVKPVNPRKQNLRALLNALPRLWGVGDEVSGRILENMKIQFLFRSEESMGSVLRRGLWSFNEWMCVTQRWNPNHTDQDLKRIPFWIQIRGIPLHFLTLRMITSIGRRMGHFLETDFGGDGAVLVDYVRVRILWNIDDPLRFQRLFQFGDEACVLKFRYEKLRNFCSVCGMISHEASKCPTTNNIPPPPPADDDDDDEGPDYNPEAPAASSPEESRPADKHVMDSGKNDESPASKKRKVEPEASSSSAVNFQVFPLVCCDMKHGYATEETEHQVIKRECRQSEAVEVRNWFLVPENAFTQGNNSGRNAPTTPTKNGDGTVGNKPPEPQ